MKQSILCIRVMFLAIVAISVIAVTSCKKKKEENENIKFIGTWHLAGNCSVLGTTQPTTFVMLLEAGTGGNSLIFKTNIASDTAVACQKDVIMNLTASGNNITMPAQTFTDGCGATQTVSGTGTLSGTTLSLTLTSSTTILGFPISTSCAFTGTK